jgi:hypothetical protein
MFLLLHDLIPVPFSVLDSPSVCVHFIGASPRGGDAEEEEKRGLGEEEKKGLLTTKARSPRRAQRRLFGEERKVKNSG